MAPTDPRNALVVQRVVLVLTVMALGLVVALGVIVALATPVAGIALTLPLLVATLVLGAAVVSMIGPARALVANLRAHVADTDAHHCQCSPCGATFTANPDSPTGAAARVALPRERVAATRSATVGFTVGAVLVVLGAITYYLVLGAHRERLWVEGKSQALFQVFFIIMAAMLAVCLAITVWSRRVAEREIARIPVSHVCTCRWCGRPQPSSSSKRGSPSS